MLYTTPNMEILEISIEDVVCGSPGQVVDKGPYEGSGDESDLDGW